MGLTIDTFCVNDVGENTYLLTDSGEAVLIDCGCFRKSEWLKVRSSLERSGCQLKALWQTHLHFDHTLGVPLAFADFPVPWFASPDDAPLLQAMKAQIDLFLGPQAAQNFDLDFIHHTPTRLHEGDQLQVGHTTFQVIATPGHTPGGLVFYAPEEHLLFTGDTLFAGSVGRTDLPGGDWNTLCRSLRKLCLLPPQTTILPGHGPASTLGEELRHNPYLRAAQQD